jgi:hypothetical protein
MRRVGRDPLPAVLDPMIAGAERGALWALWKRVRSIRPAIIGAGRKGSVAAFGLGRMAQP